MVRKMGCQVRHRENIPPAISDTGFLSATRGTYDMMIRMILAHRTDGNIAAVGGGGDVFCMCRSTESVCVCVCSKKK